MKWSTGANTVEEIRLNLNKLQKQLILSGDDLICVLKLICDTQRLNDPLAKNLKKQAEEIWDRGWEQLYEQARLRHNILLDKVLDGGELSEEETAEMRKTFDILSS